jgi:hypothetical protein
MRFWGRELAGWTLVLLGLGIFYLCFALLLNRRVLEAGQMLIMGIVVFRGGIHLLKVAVAARVCWQARRLEEPPAPRRLPLPGRRHRPDAG